MQLRLSLISIGSTLQKPANVLINNVAGPKPVVKITDFGLSRLRNTTVVTATPGAGTPAYLAPECYEAAEGRTVAITYKADLYSLGACGLAGFGCWLVCGRVSVSAWWVLRRCMHVRPMAGGACSGLLA